MQRAGLFVGDSYDNNGFKKIRIVRYTRQVVGRAKKPKENK